ncbi:MAG: MoaD/ThiS family protein [Acidimicrobiia bacterium]|nr:MoaD/ThiS family protein [Acidimicrobiia bacterium]
MPTLRIPDALRRYAGGEAVLEAAGAMVGEVLDDAFRRHPDLQIRLVDEAGVVRSHLAVFRNEEQLPRERAAGEPLGPGDTLTLLLAVDGG